MIQPDNPKTHITWSDNDGFLQDFTFYYRQAQQYHAACSSSRRFFIPFFTAIHEIYRMEEPYFENNAKSGKTELEMFREEYEQLENDVNQYLSQDENFRYDNFHRILSKADRFFSKLTHVAVEKGFFPKVGKARTLEDVKKTLRQQ